MRQISILALALFFVGCSMKEAPLYLYRDVLVPVKCKAKMPKKPTYKGEFEGAKAKMIYYKRCESLLLYCIGEKDGNTTKK